MKKVCLFVILFFISSSLFSENVKSIITSYNKEYAGERLQLFRYNNLLTQEEILVTDFSFDKKGQLKIECDVEETQLFFIPLYSFKLVFYIQKGESIDLKMPSLEKIKSFFHQHKLYDDREIALFATNECLNNRINSYNTVYGKLLKQHFKKLYNSQSAEWFLKELPKIPPLHNVSFLQQYLVYKNAYIYYVSGLKSKILSQYYAGKAPQELNPAYISLLQKIAKEKVSDFISTIKYRTYKNIKSYADLALWIRGITGVKDAMFNEFFLITMLYEGTKIQYLEAKDTKRYLHILSSETKYQKNKKFAESVLKSISHNFENINSPVFEFEEEGIKYTQEELKGNKPTILLFVDNEKNNAGVIEEISNLQRKTGNKFYVKLFSCGFLPEKIENITWKQFFIPYQHRFLRSFHLKTFPHLVLLDKEGNVTKETWEQYFLRLQD